MVIITPLLKFMSENIFGINKFCYDFCSSVSKLLKSSGKLVLNSHHSSVKGCLNPSNSAWSAWRRNDFIVWVNSTGNPEKFFKGDFPYCLSPISGCPIEVRWTLIWWVLPVSSLKAIKEAVLNFFKTFQWVLACLPLACSPSLTPLLFITDISFRLTGWRAIEASTIPCFFDGTPQTIAWYWRLTVCCLNCDD